MIKEEEEQHLRIATFMSRRVTNPLNICDCWSAI